MMISHVTRLTKIIKKVSGFRFQVSGIRYQVSGIMNVFNVLFFLIFADGKNEMI